MVHPILRRVVKGIGCADEKMVAVEPERQCLMALADFRREWRVDRFALQTADRGSRHHRP